MEIRDKNTLSVLMTALYVAKWDSNEDSSYIIEISGSPFLARLYNDVVDEMIRLESDKHGANQKWMNWRSIEQRPRELEKTRTRIKNMALWAQWPREQRQQIIEYLLSPFNATQPTLEELLSL
jgi:hypothetical protein